MKKNKKAFIALGVIVLIVIIIFIFLTFKDFKKTSSLNKQAKVSVKNFTNLVISGGTQSELKEISGLSKFLPKNIMTGDDSYLNRKPSDKIIKQNNLSDYVSKGEKYINNFENKLKGNYKYKIDYVSIKNGQAQVAVTITPYYYSVYIGDLDNLQDKILTMAGSNDNISKYKAKVKAMEILDAHLDEYINKDNKIQTAVLYDKDNSSEMKNSFNSYLMSLNGYNHNNEILNSLYQSSNERVNGYMAEAINDGVLSSSSPLP